MKKTAIFLIAAARMFQTCYADSIDIVEYDRLSQKVKVTGRYSNVDIFRPMFVMKINDGNNKLNLMTQCDKVETEGKFSFEIPLNDRITKITTPYFEGYELDVMGKLGFFGYIEDMLESYWKGMLDIGATTV